MKNYPYSELVELLNKIDTKNECSFIAVEPEQQKYNEFVESLSNYLEEKEENRKAILGIDIFEYSKYEYNKQKLIPFILKNIIDTTIENCFKLESNISDHYKKDKLKEEIIDTGDGGFVIFQSPIDAIIFLIFFAANLHSYNSYHGYPNLRKYIGPLTIRYAITYDRVYQIGKNYYGPAIINNARIMSKDTLNRLLIDGDTYEWFLLNGNGIENLFLLNREHLFLQKPLKGATVESIRTLVFNRGGNQVIRNVFCQKLEKIKVKHDNFDVYNLIIQISLSMYDDEDKDQITFFTTTIGNMNCIGI